MRPSAARAPIMITKLRLRSRSVTYGTSQVGAELTSIFLGYPAQTRAHTELLRTAAGIVHQQTGEMPVLWEDMITDGRLIIKHVLAEIDRSELCVFDLTWQNENVLFEAGYAIARGKRVLFTLDITYKMAKRKWKDFALLNPVGYTEYRNSAELGTTLAAIDEFMPLGAIYDELIEPSLPDHKPRRSVLYCATFEPFEAANRLSGFWQERQKRGVSLLVSDPAEASLEPITWYAPAITNSAGVLVHFAGRQRNLSELHNARHAFVAGMSVGLEVPTLMLSEEAYPTPFDFQTLLRKYDSAEECVAIARDWFSKLVFDKTDWAPPSENLRSKLSGLRFGEHVAENELRELSEYFVPTSAFEQVTAARDTVFVGQRGAGKTANAIRAFETVAEDKRNMAVLIKPPGFEYPSLFAAIERLPDYQHDYFFDTFWRFVVQTEIAASVVGRLEERARGVPPSPAESDFLSYIDQSPFDVRAEMSARLEQALSSLIAKIGEHTVEPASTRNLINEAFHSTALATLRHQLGPLLKDRNRVAVFVDNLDKGWERGANFRLVARLILGLLTARGRLVRDFEKQDWWRDRIKLTVAIFLRSDIFSYLLREAREPDKLAISTITWNDAATLVAVIEARFATSGIRGSRPGDLWSEYFCDSIGGVPTREFITTVVLPRPRDIVYFCNAAVGRAIDRRHDQVGTDDLLSAEETYSQYAYEALLVENGVTIPEMRTAIYEFLGAPAILNKRDIVSLLGGSGLTPPLCEAVFAKLIALSFLGLETASNTFVFSDMGVAMERNQALAARVQRDADERRYKIHRAFHRFLMIEGG